MFIKIVFTFCRTIVQLLDALHVHVTESSALSDLYAELTRLNRHLPILRERPIAVVHQLRANVEEVQTE